MKIGELSKISCVSEQTIRFYIKKGLLIPLHTSYQYSFSKQDLKDLDYIQSCKRMGFSLEEILRLLSLHRVAASHAPKEASPGVGTATEQLKTFATISLHSFERAPPPMRKIRFTGRRISFSVP